MHSVSDQVKRDIMKKLIEPCYYKDVKDLITERDFWRKLGNIFESSGKIFVGTSSIAAFSSGMYKYDILSFVAGTTSVVSLICMQFSSYSYNESKERTSKLNKLLHKLGVESIPDISYQIQTGETQQQSNTPSNNEIEKNSTPIPKLQTVIHNISDSDLSNYESVDEKV